MPSLIRRRTLYQIQPASLAAFFGRVASSAPDLLPACRWLLMGPSLARWVCPTDGVEPSLPEMIELLRFLDGEELEIEAVGHALATTSLHLDEARIEHGLDRLLGAEEDQWTHPAVVLGRPCPKFTDLLARCTHRLATADADAHQRLEGVRAKLEHAVALERTTRRRAGLT